VTSTLIRRRNTETHPQPIVNVQAYFIFLGFVALIARFGFSQVPFPVGSSLNDDIYFCMCVEWSGQMDR